jgi:hypothetical protein
LSATIPKGFWPAIYFVSVTASFRLLYVFVVMEVETRRIAHFNATRHRTPDWTLQQCGRNPRLSGNACDRSHKKQGLYLWNCAPCGFKGSSIIDFPVESDGVSEREAIASLSDELKGGRWTRVKRGVGLSCVRLQPGARW